MDHVMILIARNNLLQAIQNLIKLTFMDVFVPRYSAIS